jgi:hypothetical protein
MALRAAHAAAAARIAVAGPRAPDSGAADQATQAAASRLTAPAFRAAPGRGSVPRRFVAAIAPVPAAGAPGPFDCVVVTGGSP